MKIAQSAVLASSLSSEFHKIYLGGHELDLYGDLVYCYSGPREYGGFRYIDDSIEMVVDSTDGMLEALDLTYHNAPLSKVTYTITSGQALVAANATIASSREAGDEFVSEFKAVASPNDYWNRATPSGPNRAVLVCRLQNPEIQDIRSCRER